MSRLLHRGLPRHHGYRPGAARISPFHRGPHLPDFPAGPAPFSLPSHGAVRAAGSRRAMGLAAVLQSPLDHFRRGRGLSAPPPAVAPFLIVRPGLLHPCHVAVARAERNFWNPGRQGRLAFFCENAALCEKRRAQGKVCAVRLGWGRRGALVHRGISGRCRTRTASRVTCKGSSTTPSDRPGPWPPPWPPLRCRAVHRRRRRRAAAVDVAHPRTLLSVSVPGADNYGHSARAGPTAAWDSALGH